MSGPMLLECALKSFGFLFPLHHFTSSFLSTHVTIHPEPPYYGAAIRSSCFSKTGIFMLEKFLLKKHQLYTYPAFS